MVVNALRKKREKGRETERLLERERETEERGKKEKLRCILFDVGPTFCSVIISEWRKMYIHVMHRNSLGECEVVF